MYLMRNNFLGWLGPLLLAALLGCNARTSIQTFDAPSDRAEEDRSGELRQAIRFLSRLEEYDPAQVQQRILAHLQQWIKVRRPADSNWSIDPMVGHIPPLYQGLVAPERLQDLRMEPFDVQVMQEAIWMRDVARSVATKGHLPPLLSERVSESISADQPTHGSLAQATILFDWTVRNLKLDAPLSQEPLRRYQSNVLLQAWESLLLGRGTPAEKSRVFVLLARQLGLPVVMLTGRDVDDDPTEASVAGLLVGNDLYLFDMRLGTPLPGPQRRGIATLRQVQADPSLLKVATGQTAVDASLDPEDLSGLILWIDATPSDLSQRMKLIEEALLGEDKVVLTTQPSALAQRLREVTQIGDISLWPLPYEAFRRRSQLQANDIPVRILAAEHALFSHQTPLLRARLLHFRGQYEDSDDQLGARSAYLRSRASEEEIRQLLQLPLPDTDAGSSSDAQQRVQQHATRMKAAESMLRRAKETASFWLGTMAFDRGDYQVAIDFFEKRLLAQTPSGYWADMARYNLGRSLEALGRTRQDEQLRERARTVYLQVIDSPMTDACRVRAHWISTPEP